ncbi:hypothetical protein ZIOFF_042259 [Zingiber officinale]|uniref:Uncharacterized protein n=1 Tax=Zingiber officinale TaxID=94328 RepID=A0A8J5GKP1_ZINOF|nr:hypothetical protein ZIOFF_042259 [Zingiber officinale]
MHSADFVNYLVAPSNASNMETEGAPQVGTIECSKRAQSVLRLCRLARFAKFSIAATSCSLNATLNPYIAIEFATYPPTETCQPLTSQFDIAPPPSPPPSRNNKTIIIVISAIGGCFVLIMAVVFVWWCIWKRHPGSVPNPGKRHLEGKKSKAGRTLSWSERLKITIGAAEDLEAKIADLGLSKAYRGDDEINVSTNVVGTPGYVDPELNNINIPICLILLCVACETMSM